MILYKYLHPDRIDVLETGLIRFTQPAVLNDPFETMPCYSKYKEYLNLEFQKKYPNIWQKIGDKTPEIIEDNINSMPNILSKKFAILSLSKNNNNALMWAHYADAHQGFVIGFNSENDFFKPGNGKARDGVKEVKYSQNRYVIPRGGFEHFTEDEIKEANEYFFFTKSKDWAYEEECRILGDPEKADKVIEKRDIENIYLFRFPVKCLKEVIFGFRMKLDRRKEILKILGNKYSHAELFESLLSEIEFNFRIVPYMKR